MTAARAPRRRAGQRVTRVIESLPAGHVVRGAGTQLAHLFADDLLAWARERQRVSRMAAAPHATNGGIS